jgi:hypothetical protein
VIKPRQTQSFLGPSHAPKWETDFILLELQKWEDVISGLLMAPTSSNTAKEEQKANKQKVKMKEVQ